MTEAVQRSETPLASRLEVECAAVDTFAKWVFDQHLIHEAGEQFDALPGRAPRHASKEDVAAWRDLMTRYNDPDTREGSLSVHPHLAHEESQALYKCIASSLDWESYVKLSQSQSRTSQSQGTSQTRASQAFRLSPAPNQEQQKQKLQLKEKQKPQKPQAGIQRSLKSFLELPNDGVAGSPQRGGSTDRALSPRRSERAHTTPSRLSGFVLEKDTDEPTATGNKRKAVASSPEDDESEDEGLPSVSSKRLKTGIIIPGRSPNRQSSNDRTSSTSRVAAKASTEEAAQLAAASRDPEFSEDDQENERALPPARSRPISPAGTAALAKNPKAASTSSGIANAASEARRVLASSKGKAEPSKKWTTYPPASTSQKAKTGTRRTDRTLLDTSRGVPQQSSRDAIYEHNIKLSQPAVDSLFGAEMSKGYDNFEYYSTFLDGDIKKEWWVCIKCGQHKRASRAGSSTNLVHHGNNCQGVQNLAKAPSGSSSDDTEETAVDAQPPQARLAVSSTATGTTYSGLSLVSWLSGGHSVNLQLTRRKAVLLVIRNALAFRLLSTDPFKEFIQSIDVRMTLALKSHQTVRRDVHKIYKLMKRDVRAQLHNTDTLVSLQHDAWTNKGFQHSFVVILASWVDRDWKYREMLLSFDVLDDRHSGATFAGHMIRTLRRFNLDKKWFGPVISDSTGTNHRMLDLLEHELAGKQMQQRHDQSTSAAADTIEAAEAGHAAKKADKEVSVSAFPDATSRKSGSWRAKDNKILCMNHHINLAVRAGFATFGLSIKTKTQRKILPLRPTVILDDGEGNSSKLVEGDQEEDEDDDDEDINFDEEDEDDEEGDEESDGADEESDREDDEDADPVAQQGPHSSEVEEDDGGGPGAEVTTTTSKSRRNLKTALGRLEGFVTTMSRSDLRKKAFRLTIEKEYLHDEDPARAKSALPPKPNATRWNSHLAMIESAIKIKEAINQHCRSTIGRRDDVFGKFLLSEQQWVQLEALKPLLELAQDITKELEAAEGTLCLVLDHHASLRDEIEGLFLDLPQLDLDANLRDELKAFLLAMSKKLGYYRDLALANRLTNVAAILHPMFRLKLFKDAYPRHAHKAEQHLRGLVNEMFGSTSDVVDGVQDPAAITPQASTSSKAGKRKSRVAESRHKRQQKVSEGGGEKGEAAPDEISRYLDHSNSAWRESDTPYKWWADNEQQFPMLAKLARIVLGIPGSSSSSERAFSRAALYSTNRRARLTASAIGQLVSVNDWLCHGADPLIGLGTEARQTAAIIARIPNPKM